MPFESLPARDFQSDRELAALAKNGDSNAFAVLSERYKPAMIGRAGRYSTIVGVDLDDFVQEGMLALYRAVVAYDATKETQFSTYAIACIRNAMSAAIKKHMKGSLPNSYVNIDEIDEKLLRNVLPHTAQDVPVEDLFFDSESEGLFLRQMQTLLSSFEQQVLELYLQGHPYRKIADVLRTSTKAVDNALQRVRRKLRPD